MSGRRSFTVHVELVKAFVVASFVVRMGTFPLFLWEKVRVSRVLRP